MNLTLGRVIETCDEDVAHEEVDEADDTRAQSEFGDFVEKRLIRIHVDKIIKIVFVEITASIVEVGSRVKKVA